MSAPLTSDGPHPPNPPPTPFVFPSLLSTFMSSSFPSRNFLRSRLSSEARPPSKRDAGGSTCPNNGEGFGGLETHSLAGCDPSSVHSYRGPVCLSAGGGVRTVEGVSPPACLETTLVDLSGWRRHTSGGKYVRYSRTFQPSYLVTVRFLRSNFKWSFFT